MSHRLPAVVIAGLATAFLVTATSGLVSPTTASAESQRPCGTLTTGRGTVKVTTSGAGGPRCGEARRVAKATFRKRLRRTYRGYRCSLHRTGEIAWSCHGRGARNVTLWRIAAPEPSATGPTAPEPSAPGPTAPKPARSIAIDVDPLEAGPGDTLQVDVSIRAASARDAVILYTTDDACYETYGEASNRGDVVVDDYAPQLVESDLLGIYHTSVGVGTDDQPAHLRQVCAMLYDGDLNRTYATASKSVSVGAGDYYDDGTASE